MIISDIIVVFFTRPSSQIFPSDSIIDLQHRTQILILTSFRIRSSNVPFRFHDLLNISPFSSVCVNEHLMALGHGVAVLPPSVNLDLRPDAVVTNLNTKEAVITTKLASNSSASFSGDHYQVRSTGVRKVTTTTCNVPFHLAHSPEFSVRVWWSLSRRWTQ